MSSKEKCGIRVHDLCSVVDNRWLTDDLLDFVFQAMSETTASHFFQMPVLSEPFIFSHTFRKRFCETLKERIDGGIPHIHFAASVRRSAERGLVTVGSGGNHWMYFCLTTTDGQMLWRYFGMANTQKFAFHISANISIAITLCTPHNPTLMHDPDSFVINGQHKCSAFCYKAFPRQQCGNLCGFNPLFMCSLAATHHLIWKSIVGEHQPPLNLLLGVSSLTNLSKYLCLIRIEVMSWLVNRQVNVSPFLLDYENLPRESLSVTNAKQIMTKVSSVYFLI